MALFKIAKGTAANLAANRPNTTEGYCYITTDEKKFYVDLATATGTTNRICLNANEADTAKTLSSTLAIGKGGTGSSDGATGLKNLFAAGPTILSTHQYGTTLPTTNLQDGRMFFVIEEG